MLSRFISGDFLGTNLKNAGNYFLSFINKCNGVIRRYAYRFNATAILLPVQFPHVPCALVVKQMEN